MANRYYDSGADVEIKPGKISAELREALNIAENDIPLWIYRMRALGYPPGWLRKAVVDTSDIFDTETSSPKDSDNNDLSSASGAGSSSSNSRKRKNPPTSRVTVNQEVQYDHSKLIEYPGFNMPMPKNCVDYHYYINMPAMLEHQQLEYAKKHMNSFKPNLNTSASSIKSKTPSTPGSEHKKVKLEDNKQKTTEDSEESSSAEQDPNVSTTSTILNSSTFLAEEIKLVSKGSPMPKPVKRAPLEKFSEGIVGDLLYFENLPAQSGKFDTIRELISKMNDSTSSNKDNSTQN